MFALLIDLKIKVGQNGRHLYMAYFDVKKAPKMPQDVRNGSESVPLVVVTEIYHIFQGERY